MALADFAPEVIDLEEDEDIVNLMVYGSAGVGKTVFAGSAPRVLFLAPEDGGTLSAKRQGSKAKKWKVNNFEDLVTALNRIIDNIDEIKENFDWLAIDSITHMQKLTMRQILDDAVAENPERDPDIPQMQDWQKYQNMFLRVVQAYNDLPINVVWTALVRSEEDEEGEEFLIPDIQGKGYQMAITIASYMTSYGCMQAKDVPVKLNGELKKDSEGNVVKRTVRTITWHDTGKIRGKDRTDTLAPQTKNLTLEQVGKLISGEAKKSDFVRSGAKKAPAKAPAKKVAAKKTSPATEPVEEAIPAEV
jgi:hypothetical protein